MKNVEQKVTSSIMRVYKNIGQLKAIGDAIYTILFSGKTFSSNCIKINLNLQCALLMGLAYAASDGAVWLFSDAVAVAASSAADLPGSRSA